MGRLLIVDDEPVLREVLGTLLRRSGYAVIEAGTVRDASAAFDDDDDEIELVLLDLMLPDGNGMDVLKEIRRRSPATVVVVITAYSSIDGAIEAMREGAFHYVPKPFKNQEVLLTVRRGLEQRALESENAKLRGELDAVYGLGSLIGKSEPMRKVFELIRLAAPSSSHVAVEGEPGSGRELVARTIHHHSKRAKRPFVVVSAAGIDAEVLERTLVGGKDNGGKSVPGLFETAHGGTLFLEDVGEMPRRVQELLAKTLRSGEYRPDGSPAVRRFEVRVIASTAGNLGKLAAKKQIPRELAEALQGVTVALPPLRDRRDDVPLLARFFADRAAADLGAPPPVIAPEVLRSLISWTWPGNVRELEETMARATAIAADGRIGISQLPPEMRTSAGPETSAAGSVPLLPADGMSFKDAVQEYQRQMILRALSLGGGVQKQAAELLRIKPTTLNEMIKRLGLQVE